jgi:thiol-disulfide isomerase/thioredoxin
MQKSIFSKIIYLGLAFAFLGGVYMWYRYKVPKYIVGEQAADFQAVLTDGSNVKLSDLRGNYVLLQFWGSWCGPCRKENPELVALYSKYGGKGFEIFSVGIEQNKERWQSAIQKDNMNWKYHSLEIGEFDGPIAQLYRVLQIPNLWLIDPNGVIVGHNMEFKKLEELIAKH